MTTSSADEEINPTDNTEDALLDSLSASLKKLLNKGKSRGYITVDELNGALPPEKESSEQIEDVMAMISDMGINLIENDEAEEETPENEEDDGFKLDETEVSRTDDPVRMYLREMGAVELLSREGEIAIAKRIEAGRDLMIGGLCESALTIKALSGWHNALISGKMLLRDIIDLDATYGSDEDAPALSLATSLPSAAVMAEESSAAHAAAEEEEEKDEEEEYEEYDEEETPDEEKPRREKPKAGKKPASGFSIFLLAIMVLLLLFLLICLVVMLMKCGIIPGADSHFVRSFAIWFNSHLFPLF